MHTHTIYLKQHTPIIHFQAEQEGATLRATEVKPKLDRLITKKLDLIDSELAKEFKAEIEFLKDAMNKKRPTYSLKIRCVERNANSNSSFQYYFFDSQKLNEDETYRVSNHLTGTFQIPEVQIVAPAPYFANRDKVKAGEEKWAEVRLGVQWTGYIEITFSSWKKRIIELLEEAAPYLFMIENFGTRQSKGFGCFSTLPEVSPDKLKKGLQFFDFARKRQAPDSLNDLFKNVANTYKKLKAKPGKEVISDLRDYFLEYEDIRWEREFVRDRLAKNINHQGDVKYVRALLGLAENYDYQQLDETTVKIEHIEEHIERKIDRFQSPILFKVYQNQLYLLANPVNSNMFNQPFRFYVVENVQEATDNNRIETIYTPEEQTFDIVDFLNNSLNDSWKNV